MKGLKFGGNMYVILVYDINLEEKAGQKILNKVFKTCKKYLIHIQNSVFEGEFFQSYQGKDCPVSGQRLLYPYNTFENDLRSVF